MSKLCFIRILLNTAVLHSLADSFRKKATERERGRKIEKKKKHMSNQVGTPKTTRYVDVDVISS